MNAIIQLFREKGYAATSLDDLSAATGLTRPSLYAAFGDKLSMYLAAIEAFIGEQDKMGSIALAEAQTVQKALEEFYKAMLVAYYSGTEACRGCLLFGTAPGATDIAEVKGLLQVVIKRLDDAMIQRFTELIGKGEPTKVRAAAELAANTLIGISIRSRAGASRWELTNLAKRSAALIASMLEN